MRSLSVFHGTRVFAWVKFGLCFLMLACAVGLFTIMVGLSMLASPVLGWFMFVLWLILCILVGFFFYQRVLIKWNAAHICAMMRCYTTGKFDPDMFYKERQASRKRFHNAGGYFKLHRTVLHAIAQQQRYFETVTDDMEDVPGMKTLLRIGKYLEHLMLRFLADGCMGYICWCEDLSVFAAAKEAVAVYAYNWRRLTEKAGEMSAVMVSATVILSAGAAVGLSALFGVMKLNAYIYLAVLLGIALIFVLKYAFLESYYTCRMMKALLDNAQDTVLSDGLYHRLQRVSKSYHYLCKTADRVASDRKKRLDAAKQKALPSGSKEPRNAHQKTVRTTRR